VRDPREFRESWRAKRPAKQPDGSVHGNREWLVAGRMAIRFFVVFMAQIPLPATCEAAVAELKMHPPACGDQGRTVYEWDMFIRQYEEKMGGTGKTFPAEERFRSEMRGIRGGLGLPPKAVDKIGENTRSRGLIALVNRD
jgi:hypothetical protein